jgi:hypothetical protein
MIKWTTPTLKCTIPEGIEFDYILLTLMQDDVVVEKTITDVVDNTFEVFFTQEETSLFKLFKKIEAQLNIINGEVRMATNIVELGITKNLHDSLIEVE